MNNYFFTSIGLEYIDIGIILTALAGIILILLILNIVNMCLIAKLRKKYKKFMQGKNANSLENEITALFEDNKFIKSSIEKNKTDIKTLYHKFESSFQKIGIIKYDAFSQIGGKLSFCLALLDENNNGFILNSVHSTDGCYSYTKETAKDFLEMGFYFGIGGVITFKDAKKLVEAVEYIPMDKLLLETDSPYLAPEPYRGKRNDSTNLPFIAEKIAQIKGISTEQVIDKTNENARKILNLVK